jgi:hypothetical protein
VPAKTDARHALADAVLPKLLLVVAKALREAG